VIHKNLEMAYKAMALVKSVEDGKREDYLRAVRGLGSMIMENGIAATLLFMKKKGLVDVIRHLDELLYLKTNVEDFSSRVIDEKAGKPLTAAEYLNAQMAAVDGASWLKRYAEIYFSGDVK